MCTVCVCVYSVCVYTGMHVYSMFMFVHVRGGVGGGGLHDSVNDENVCK